MLALALGLEQLLSVDPGIELALGLDSHCSIWSLGPSLGLDLHFAALVAVLQTTFMQLLSACGVRVRES